MRGFLLAVTILVILIKYIHEIISMNADMLEHIFQVKEIIEHSTGLQEKV